jgi:signal recognition particle subunit SRP54
MFEQLTARLEQMMKFLRGEARVNEKNLTEALKMLRLALLEADVNYKVVKDLEARVREKALGAEVLESLSPGQQVIKVLRDELTAVLGGAGRGLAFAAVPPSIFMLVGLQGSGKTTTCGKLALWAKGRGRSPLLVSFDIKRPAAQEQLRTIAGSLGLAFYEMTADRLAFPETALRELVAHAKGRGYDPLIVDTAGRLHIDDELMEELRLAREVLEPHEVVYVADAMTGQDAVRSAQAFSERIGLTAVILTKLDGDTRGGAALSIAAVTGKPIKFIGVGEKMDKLEPFHPDRMASRILGLGDMLSLIEKAEQAADREEAEELAARLKRQEFTLEDFRNQLTRLKKMGSLADLLGHLPRTGPFKSLAGMEVDERRLRRFAAIIDSMTPEERRDPRLLDGSRRRRIARGSGRTVQEVNELVKSFLEMQRMMRKGPWEKLASGKTG